MSCGCVLHRRGLLGLLAASAVSGCSENAATGRRQFVVVSEEQAAAMAADAWTDLKRKTPQSADPVLNRRVTTVGRRIAQVSGLQGLDWEFVVFDQKEVNAFVLPGGKVGVFRGLLEATRDDDELAAVIGHEVGHVQARHSAERISQELAAKAGVAVVAAVVSGSGDYGQYADEIAGALGLGLTVGVILPYSRNHELEADRLGLSLAKAAGYDPTAAVRFWERRIASAQGGGQPPEFLSTHPADEGRLRRLRAEAAALG